jgi:hypothetical protein
MISLKFSYSTSPNHDLAVTLARRADSHSVAGEGKEAIYTCAYDISSFPDFEQLYKIVCGWKSSVLTVGGKPYSSRDIYKIGNIYNCWKQAVNLLHQEAHCQPYGDKYMGRADFVERKLTRCKQIRIINPTRHWLTYSYLNSNGNWTIDKQHIKQLFENCLYISRADLCPLFNAKDFYEVIDDLPEEISPEMYDAIRCKDSYSGVSNKSDVSVSVTEDLLEADKVIPFHKYKRD